MKREPAVRAALSKMYRSGKNTGVLHDMKCTGAMHPLSSDVIKVSFFLLSFVVIGIAHTACPNGCQHEFTFRVKAEALFHQGGNGSCVR